MDSHLILECPFWSKCNETGLNYCSIIMNRFYHGTTNQKRSLIKLVSAETQRAHSPCPKDLTIRIGRDRLGGREKGAEWTLNYNSFLWLVWRGRQEEAKRGRAQEKSGAAEQGGRSGLRSQHSQPLQSFLLCLLHPWARGGSQLQTPALREHCSG